MLHVLISLFGAPSRVKRILAFSQMFRFDPGSSINQNTNNIFHVVRFDTVTLLSFDFPSKLSQVPAGYALCCMFAFPTEVC